MLDNYRRNQSRCEVRPAAAVMMISELRLPYGRSLAKTGSFVDKNDNSEVTEGHEQSTQAAQCNKVGNLPCIVRNYPRWRASIANCWGSGIHYCHESASIWGYVKVSATISVLLMPQRDLERMDQHNPSAQYMRCARYIPRYRVVNCILYPSDGTTITEAMAKKLV